MNRLKPYVEEILGDCQSGIRENRSIIDQIFFLNRKQTKRLEEKFRKVFIDLTKI